MSPTQEQLTDAIHEVKRYEDYLSSVLPQDKAKAKAYLSRVLEESVLSETFPGANLPCGLPEAQITQKDLESLFPDEKTARLYLKALKDRDTTLLEIEGWKQEATATMVGPLSEPKREYLHLLELIWAVQDDNDKALSKPLGANFLVDQYAKWGDESRKAIFDTWAKAELSRIRMREYIRNLSKKKTPKRSEIVKGTHFEKSRKGIREWLIMAALVAQARKSPTGSDFTTILQAGNRVTPNTMLKSIRKAMALKLERHAFRQGEIAYLDGMVPDCRLYFQRPGARYNILHRRDMALAGIGNVMVEYLGKNPVNNNFTHPSENPVFKFRKALDVEEDYLNDAFEDWIQPHINEGAKRKNHLALCEFAYRHQGDKRQLMGWRLINGLLRDLLRTRE